MKKLLSLSAILTVALLVGAACQAASTAGFTTNGGNQTALTNAVSTTDTQTKTDDAPRITLADAKADFDAGKAVIVDSRPAESYKLEHIKGAINVPLGDFDAHYKEIPTDKKIIVYCS